MGEVLAEVLAGLFEVATDWGPRWLRVTCWVILALLVVAIVALLLLLRAA